MRATGVGSVGPFWIINLFTSRDDAPLFLEVKQAGKSVLECLGPQFNGHPGQRITAGQRILQATRDLFLGCADDGECHKYFYVRQVKDRWPGSLDEICEKDVFKIYVRLCAKTLACAHARSASPAVIAGYMGEDDSFDDALASFAMVYAARTKEDYDSMTRRGTKKLAG
jgi:hypothetical protein